MHGYSYLDVDEIIREFRAYFRDDEREKARFFGTAACSAPRPMGSTVRPMIVRHRRMSAAVLKIQPVVRATGKQDKSLAELRGITESCLVRSGLHELSLNPNAGILIPAFH